MTDSSTALERIVIFGIGMGMFLGGSGFEGVA